MKDWRFADEPGTIAESERWLQMIMNSFNEMANKSKMKTIIKKTKVIDAKLVMGNLFNLILNVLLHVNMQKFNNLIFFGGIFDDIVASWWNGRQDVIDLK